MGRIRVLSDQVANQIAAGEVVERPASVVKELLENSLDAGAARLKVEVDSGGRKLIRVSDDGCGMLRDDALLAFERHATSKLSGVKDLLAISTLGFRGEALPSVAAVSRLVLETRSAEEATGMRVEIAGGKMIRAEEVALPPGTLVVVRDLFYNIPARKKFLRSEQTELAHIASLVTHYSLAHQDKSLALYSNSNELLNVTPAGGLKERIYQVFGSRILEELVDLGTHERQLDSPPYVPPSQAASAWPAEPEEPPKRTFRLRGFVSRPQYQKLNRNSIFLFVNQRLIRDRLLLHAISSAYHNLMPAACHPFALLFLECDCAEVDVNVHPSKTEVRFRHGSFVHDFVRDAVRAALVESKPASSLAPPIAWTASGAPQRAANLPFSEFTMRMEGQPWPEAPSSVLQPQEAFGTLPLYTLPAVPHPGDAVDASEGSEAPAQPEAAGRATLQAVSAAPAVDVPVGGRVPDTHAGFPADAMPDANASLSCLADLRPLGQLHESFIIAVGRDGLWIIDQHVAHERLLFEKVLRQRAAGKVESQRLLLPMVLELTAAQEVDYARIAEELRAVGFETEPFGQRTIAIKAAPAGVAAGDIEKVVSEILDIAVAEMRSLSPEGLQRAVAAAVACRAAIKVNTHLDQAKMEWLLAQLASTDCPMTCPHGRPVALRYSTRDVLRGFHRI
jgi:DNA mismatch repair protein MutL